MKQVEVGLCLFPVSFSDWAKQTSSRKFNVGFPTRAGGGSVTASSGSFQIAKTYAALQSLKSKYSIDDGDADMLILKELLSSMTAASSVSATPVSGGGVFSSMSGGVSRSSSSSSSSQGGGLIGGFRHDIGQFEGYVGDGIPGLQREFHDIAWQVEHLDRYGAASSLLRGLILLGFAYVSIGSFFKYQMGARGLEMVPHVSFWMEYPTLVCDGMTYSKILLGLQSVPGTLSGGVRSSGSGAFESL